jgi:hypothetical protein
MDSKVFRTRATYAVDMVARFLEEFPDLYCVMRVGDASNDDIIIGTAERKSEDKDED